MNSRALCEEIRPWLKLFFSTCVRVFVLVWCPLVMGSNCGNDVSPSYSAQLYYKGILSQMWLWSYRFLGQFPMHSETLLYFNTSLEQIKISISLPVLNSMIWQPLPRPRFRQERKAEPRYVSLKQTDTEFSNRFDLGQTYLSLTLNPRLSSKEEKTFLNNITKDEDN